jgi:menaquinone-dependent protoporphyrinogen oxidase
MELEAVHEGVDWSRYDVVAVGAPVLYGTYDKEVFQFFADNRDALDGKPNRFFNVSVVARNPEKATVEGNRCMQKFLQRSAWKPKEAKVIAGKVDYPAWPDRLVRGCGSCGPQSGEIPFDGSTGYPPEP